MCIDGKGNNNFACKSCGTMIAALIRPLFNAILFKDEYSFKDGVSDFCLETFTQSCVYAVRKYFGVTTQSNYIVNALFVIIPELWDIIDKIHKGEKVEIDWWSWLSSLVTLVLSCLGCSWFVLWIIAPIIFEMTKEFVIMVYNFSNNKV